MSRFVNSSHSLGSVKSMNMISSVLSGGFTFTSQRMTKLIYDMRSPAEGFVSREISEVMLEEEESKEAGDKVKVIGIRE